MMETWIMVIKMVEMWIRYPPQSRIILWILEKKHIVDGNLVGSKSTAKMMMMNSGAMGKCYRN